MKKCDCCGKETTNPRFCSKSCAAKVNNVKYPKRKITRKCSKEGCDELVKDYRSSRCEKHHKEYMYYHQNIAFRTIREYTERDCIKRLHPSSTFAHIRGLARSWHKDILQQPCANCGYDKHVQLCHIKPLSTFSLDTTIGEVNSKENVIQLCPNCHWDLDHNMLTIEEILREGSR